MTVGIAQIHVKRQRGKLVVQGMGQTPKGQKYIKASEELSVSNIGDKDFKAQMSAAVGKLLAEEGSPE